MDRIILHCDLNNFFASVECLYNPQIKDLPVAVCGSQEKRHGIILAKNNEAKKYGIKTAEPVWKAKQKCPSLLLVKPNYHRYLKFSKLAKEIYRNYTDFIEPFGIDECWLDVTESTKLFGDGEKIAESIRNRMKNEVGITVSVGVSYNKIFAKLGSDMKKPDAVTVINKDNFKYKVWTLPVEDMLFVGRSAKMKFDKIGIKTIGDLANSSLAFMKSLLGKMGETLWFFANGYDTSTVSREDSESLVKGIGNSLTTPKDLTDNQQIKTLMYSLAESVGERLRKHNLKARTVQITIKDNSFNYIERQEKLERQVYTSTHIAKKAYEIFLKNWDWKIPVRAIGIRVTDLIDADTHMQLSLWDDEKFFRYEIIDECMDKIRERFGHYSIIRGVSMTRDFDQDCIEENIIHKGGISNAKSFY